MEEKRTGLFENGLIWFGAGVSIAEILTGTYLAPLGMGKGLAAIIVGHIIGCLMLFLAGVIGGKVRKSAMETVKMSFGQKGSILFAVLNVLQLVGWTAIMIYDGALAADGEMDMVPGDRSVDHSVDCDRNYESGQDQYCCDGSIIYPDTDSVQGDIYGKRGGNTV